VKRRRPPGTGAVDPSIRRSADPPIPRSVVLAVHVQPRAARTEVVGLYGDALRIRLMAPPVDGAANDELVRFVAERLGIARADVEVVGGATGRAKRLRITGAGGTPDAVRDRLLPPGGGERDPA
jgi:uncharacterized protein (TIGR00251 family)